MNNLDVPREIGHDEELGRSVFSSKHAERARRSRVPHHVFLTRTGDTNISVDRLSVAPPDEALAIADAVGEARNRTFYGWAFVTAQQAEENHRQLVSSPLPNNPYHANIVLLNLAADAQREEQKQHAQELADVSVWRGR